MHLRCRQNIRNLVELYKREIITIKYSDNEITTIGKQKTHFIVEKGRVK